MSQLATLPEIPTNDAELLEQFSAMTIDELKAEFRNGIRMARESFVRSAYALRVMEEKGEDIAWTSEEYNPIFVAWLRKIAYGNMDAQLVIRWHKNDRAISAVSRLPMPDQRRLAAGELVPMVVLKPDGIPDRIMADPGKMDGPQLRQVFDSGRIRDEAEQRLYLESKRQAKAVPLPERIGPFEIDHERGLSFYTGKRGDPISLSVINAVAAAMKR